MYGRLGGNQGARSWRHAAPLQIALIFPHEILAVFDATARVANVETGMRKERPEQGQERPRRLVEALCIVVVVFARNGLLGFDV